MSLNYGEPRKCEDCVAGSAAVLAQGDGIGRRTFLVQSGIMAAIAALDACGGFGGADVTAPSVPANSAITISNYPSLASVGGVAMITVGSAPTLASDG